jgi:glycosyltransferase involved in cell wall biosynthesis
MGSMPLSSAVCCTYGRPRLLEEAIQCFLLQDYQNKELVIVNDLASQRLQLQTPDPRIRIINLPKRFPCLSSKRNYAVSQCFGDYVFVWDDDDLYLPWRMSASVAYLEANTDYDGVKSTEAIYTLDNGAHQFVTSVFHSQSCFRRSFFDRVRYEEGLSCGEDWRLEVQAAIAKLDLRPLYWLIYRWGLDIYHISGRGEEDHSDNWQAAERHAETLGLYDEILMPRLHHPYWGDVDGFLKFSLAPAAYELWRCKIAPYLD